jgi:hypothetical protein
MNDAQNYPESFRLRELLALYAFVAKSRIDSIAL